MQETWDAGSIPGLARSPGGGSGNSPQYSCLENPVNRGAWQATVHGVAKGWTRLKWLSTHTITAEVLFLQPFQWLCEPHTQNHLLLISVWMISVICNLFLTKNKAIDFCVLFLYWVILTLLAVIVFQVILWKFLVKNCSVFNFSLPIPSSFLLNIFTLYW